MSASRFLRTEGLAESVASTIQAELTAKMDFEGPITTSIEGNEDEASAFIADTSGIVRVNAILGTATFEIRVQIPGESFSRILKVAVTDELRTVDLPESV